MATNTDAAAGLDALIEGYFPESAKAVAAVASQAAVIRRMAEGIYRSQLAGGKLLIGGNGGSSADAQHFAGEMTCTFKARDRRPFSAVCLTDNSAAITAWTNDFSFDTYFERQVEALGRKGDVLFLITTGGGDRANGASMNLVRAADKALAMGLTLYSIAGKTGGELSKISHEFVKVPSFETSHIQEAHIAVIHCLCLALDKLTAAGAGASR